MRTVIILISALALTGQARATVYYVSNTGSNSNNGTSLGTPFQTIQKAAYVVGPGDTVYVRGGTYRETVTMQHSGNSLGSISFQPYQNESVTVTGLDVLNASWTQSSGNIYQAACPGSPTQMFLGGQLVSEARYPAAGQKNPLVASYYNATSATATSLTDTAHISGGTDYWAGCQLTAIPNPQYQAYSTTINSQAGSTLNFAQMANRTPSAGTPYYITGGAQSLVADRQWVFQPTTNTVLLQAPGGVNPSGQTVEVRQRQLGIDFNGQSYVNVSGFQLNAASISVPIVGSRTPHNDMIDNVQVLYPDPYGSYVGVLIMGNNNTFQNFRGGLRLGQGRNALGHNGRHGPQQPAS